MKLGLGSYTFTWAVGVPGHTPAQPLSPLALLDRARQLGLRVAQFCDNLPLTRLAPKGLEEFTDFASQHRISVELGTRGLDSENLLAHLGLARRFNAPFVRVVTDTKSDEPSPAEVMARLRPLLPRFADVGVKLALENHDRFTCATLARIVEQLGPDQVGICLDTVNSFGALEGPEVVVKTLAPYTLNLHVKDFTIARVSSQMGFVVNGCAAGQGRLNVPWLLDQLRAAGRDVNAVLELWTPFGPTLEETIAREAAWAEESVWYLRQFITE
ncbi:MAG: sugar phosphate isomerase/epimerase [Verrucomicrobia bacterium]|nr:sugar phosphate isomerase/epimerase [Verrucomicrobiota bacterium]